MDLGILVLSFFGALLSIIGWFFDHILTFDWLRQRLAPKIDIGLRGLDFLRSNPLKAMDRDEPAFTVLKNIWPQFPESPSVFAIGRTTAYLQFGSEVTSDIGLILFDKDLKRIEGYDWSFSKATDKLIGSLKKRIHRIGIIVFFLGIAITVVTAVIQYVSTLK